MMLGELNDAVERAGLKLKALRATIEYTFYGLTYEACAMLYNLRGWDHPARGETYREDFEDRMADAGECELNKLLALLITAEKLSEERLTVDMLADSPDVGKVLDAYGIDPHRWWVLAEAAAKTQLAREAVEQEEQAAGAARRKLSPTDAFIEQHGNGAAEAPARPAAKTPTKAPVKYRNPMTGETWSGRGLMPKWLKVRMAEGHKLDEYSTAGTTAAPTTTEARDAGVDQTDEGDRDADE